MSIVTTRDLKTVRTIIKEEIRNELKEEIKNEMRNEVKDETQKGIVIRLNNQGFDLKSIAIMLDETPDKIQKWLEPVPADAEERFKTR